MRGAWHRSQRRQFTSVVVVEQTVALDQVLSLVGGEPQTETVRGLLCFVHGGAVPGLLAKHLPELLSRSSVGDLPLGQQPIDCAWVQGVECGPRGAVINRFGSSLFLATWMHSRLSWASACP
ncbi:hypothetical protein CLM62_46115 [Streptomyces sp. SA15]|nr:hypothetical protein CLM62_46115 [Streptomyces sp. SA15]